MENPDDRRAGASDVRFDVGFVLLRWGLRRGGLSGGDVVVGSDVVGERVEADDDELLRLVMELILVMYALMLAS